MPFLGIRFKLSFVSFLLVTAVIAVSSVAVMGIMDRFLLGELVKRGTSLSRGAANTAAFGLLAHDRLVVDNLVAKLKERQPDVLYVAAVDHDGIITAHSDLRKNGARYEQKAPAKVISRDVDGTMVTLDSRGGRDIYEFSTPIRFAARKIGSLHLTIDGVTLVDARGDARRMVALASGLILVVAVLASYYLAGFFTTPIKKLQEGVSQLRSGKYQGALTVKLHDELGELTSNFNQMAQVIVQQQDKLEEYAHGLEESYLATVKILATSIDARDDYTLRHSTRVAALSVMLGQQLGLHTEELRDLEVAALVHDLGKIRIPDKVLKKAAPLNEEELEMVRLHTRHGAEILSHSRALQRFVPAVLYHHEWYDGQGYPEGLKGAEIPLFAKIIAIADAYDAMTTSRPYRSGLPAAIAINEITRYSGSQFEPALVDLFVRSLGQPNHAIPQLMLRLSA
ncbi:cyclic diguanylate phosphodiesterase, HAMP domain-containing [Geotalea daltonii FRC-32]|uniref:Cyclic diguanylate phosphodiesterase, HAMP domain-containing n=1 Tax=Geotalea daltonii (strain DSM 22248 / JCM 15807 / FRC-32) TaxID=316067 RepID=B9LZJ6_GEODF|nr:HD domain-containing phosphohydrolase [Geotalea daltonii]ACM20749.1 cyclic diguanylate phosphodiesterase, HAMP domain-containing [Geotalea daltonii FRC-32]